MTAAATLPEPLREALRRVRSVGVITGAGISAESGIPTYRGTGGIYEDPEEGDRTVESLSGPTLARDPDRTWRTLGRLARAAADAEPNAAHEALVAIEERLSRFVLLTQNVDGLHQRAGSRNVIDIHGTIFRTLCMVCEREDELDVDALCEIDSTPSCPRCDGQLRPDVVLFEEMLPSHKVGRLYAEFHQDMPDLVLAVGTSAMFPYILEPVILASRLGKLTVEVNLDPSDLSVQVDHALLGKAGDWLPALASALLDSEASSR